MKFATKNGTDSVAGPLKLMNDSWGPPCIELKEVKKDTIRFRTTYSANLHITANEGYFLKMPEWNNIFITGIETQAAAIAAVFVFMIQKLP